MTPSDIKYIMSLVQEVIEPLQEDIELLETQMAQLRKENQLLRTQLNNLTKAQHHSNQSMY